MDQCTKICNKCGETKPVEAFGKLSQAADGLDYRCKECQKKRWKEYRASTPDYWKSRGSQKAELERRERENNKTCTVCGEIKSLEEFHLRRGSQDGRMARCATCINSERHNEEQRARYRQRYQDNREAILEWHRAYYHANKEKRTAKNKRWYETNKHKAKATSSRHRRMYPEKYRESGRRRRERVAAASGGFTGEDVLRKLKEQRGKCYWCGQKLCGEYEVDHIIPLVRGGSNGAGNICCSCQSCNRRKSSKMPHEFSDRLF